MLPNVDYHGEVTEYTLGNAVLLVGSDGSATIATGASSIDVPSLAELRDLARLLANTAVRSALGLFERPADDSEPDGRDEVSAWLERQFGL
jgi:hypothetical protein